MIWLALMLGCGGGSGGSTFAVEEAVSTPTLSWNRSQVLKLYGDWAFSGEPTECELLKGETATVERKMHVFTTPTTHTTDAKRVMLGSDYGAVGELPRKKQLSGQPLNFELPEGSTLTVYGKHPQGRGCLFRLPDSRVVSAACIDGVYLASEPETVLQVTCEGSTGWLGPLD